MCLRVSLSYRTHAPLSRATHRARDCAISFSMISRPSTAAASTRRPRSPAIVFTTIPTGGQRAISAYGLRRAAAKPPRSRLVRRHDCASLMRMGQGRPAHGPANMHGTRSHKASISQTVVLAPTRRLRPHSRGRHSLPLLRYTRGPPMPSPLTCSLSSAPARTRLLQTRGANRSSASQAKSVARDTRAHGRAGAAPKSSMAHGHAEPPPVPSSS